MKKYLLFFISFIILLFLPISSYVELNHLIIADEIHVSCKDSYTLIIREIIPIRENNSIDYQYKEYQSSHKNLKSAKNNIEESAKDKFYYRKARIFTSNCPNKNKILELFDLKS